MQKLFTLALLLSGVTAVAQFNASVTGTVIDTTGAVVPGAKISAKNAETNRAQSATTGAGGVYRISQLPPGSYTIEAEAKGFRKATLGPIPVRAEEPITLDIHLDPGDITQTVTVTSAGSAIQTEGASVGSIIDQQQVRELPQFGRDPFELLRLAPGIFGDSARSGTGNAIALPNTTGPGGSNSSVFQTENQVQISAAGQRVHSNNYMIDGVSVNSLNYGGAAVITPNQESVRELNVTSTSFSAEDGRNTGAQVKVISQSGTNRFHGSGFFKYNTPGLNAYEKYGGFDNAPVTRVDQKFRQFGASLGGPIFKDKLFFFASYEALRDHTASYQTSWVETPQYRQLIQSQRAGTVTAAVIGSPGMDPRIRAVLPTDCGIFKNDSSQCRVVPGGLDIGSLFGAPGQYIPNNSLLGGGFDGIPDIQYAQLRLPQAIRGNQTNGRLDYYLTQRDQFAFSSYVTALSTVSADADSQGRPSSDVPFKPLNTLITAIYIHTFSSTVVNELRSNFTRLAENSVDDTAANFGIPRVEVEGLPLPNAQRIRFGPVASDTSPAKFAQNTYEIRDGATWVRGSWTHKFGVESRWEQDNSNYVGSARPDYSFVGLYNLANDAPVFEGLVADPRTGGPPQVQRYFRTRYWGGYSQNDWRARPNLTLTLGLRYEYFSPIREARHELSNLILSGTPGNEYIDARIVSGLNHLYNPYHGAWSPKLGFAWSPGGSSSLVIRGGAGIAYNRLDDVLFINGRANPPYTARFSLCCGGAEADPNNPTGSGPFAGNTIVYGLGANRSALSYPANPNLAVGIDPVTGSVPKRSVEIYGAPPNVPNSTAYLFSFEVQKNLPENMIAIAGYQGSVGRKGIRIVNQGFLYDTGQDHNFSAVYFPTPDVNSNYQALNLALNKRMSYGLQISAAYTLSKSIDQLSTEGPGGSGNQTNPAFPATERGPSDYDATHRVTAAGIWDLPLFSKRKGWIGAALGGWELSSIFTFHTGFPWTPVTGRIQSVQVRNADTISPTRPTLYFGGAGDHNSNQAFITGSNFPLGGPDYFDIADRGQPGIGRNSFRGPGYLGVDAAFSKNVRLGEKVNLQLRANAFNVFNKLNLVPFSFGTESTTIENPNFGRSSGSLAGRVFEFQGRFTF
jgi:hypothetical protein